MSAVITLCIGENYKKNSNHQLLANVKYVITRPSVFRLSSVTLLHPTQAIEIFGNVLRHSVH